MNRFLIAVVSTAFFAPVASADTADALEGIRASVEAMRTDYETRIADLEKRLAAAESALAKGATAAATTAAPPAPMVAAVAPPPPRSNNAYNPSIGLTLTGLYANYSQDPEGFGVQGFQLGGEPGPPDTGFTASHSEISFSANVDERFYGQVIAAIAQEKGEVAVELEEAFVEAGALPGGLSSRAGRFLSSIGYLNSSHAHAWDFVDAPLPYRAMLGGQYGDNGLQVRWLAPTDLFLEAGMELMSGGEFPGRASGEDFPGLVTASLRLGGDAGDSYSWLTGISRLSTDPRERGAGAEEGGGATFTGDSDLTVVDAVLKWAPNGNARNRNFKLQAELFRREEDGMISVDDGAASSTYRGTQDGFYVQGVYQFQPRWRVGTRYGWV
ncbi:MAG: hypothetical protein LJE84_05770, partial [Gammaproteobacteria bacterium]|nr:hypothetical protein [Gammaproteobacteria bacterium]